MPDAVPTKPDKKPFPSAIRAMLTNGWRLSKMIWSDRKNVFAGVILAFLFSSVAPFLLTGANGLLINDLVRRGGSGQIDAHLWLLVGIMMAATLLPSMVRLLESYLYKLFWYFLEERFETLILEKKGAMDLAIHESPQHRDLFNRVKEEGASRASGYVMGQSFTLESLISVALASGVLLYFQWWVFFIIFLGTLPDLLVELRYGQAMWSIHNARGEKRRIYWELRSHFDTLSSLVELKLFQSIPHFLSTIRGLFRDFQAEEKKNERIKLVRRLTLTCFSQGAIAFAVAYFALQTVRGTLQIGTFTFVLASITSLRQSLSGFFSQMAQQYQDSLFVTDLFRLLDLQPMLKQPSPGQTLEGSHTPEIVFDHVTFSYPGTTKMVLQDISWRIPPGEKVALVGVNGAGKTTLVKLLCRFYDPTAGRILINGRDLREIDLETWYAQLGAIFQEYAHYHFLTKEAIAVGRSDRPLSLDHVKEAAKRSESNLFIEKWEEGYDQRLGKEFTDGVEPSIGEWQKLALARTFYREPRILILDEPTSSVDAEAEAKIFEKLGVLPKDRTVFLISHRFSTVRQAHHIGVIEEGRLKELGTHEDLLKLGGTYARLFTLQAKGYQ